MAFFDADKAVNNSELKELEILGKKVEVNEKKGILYLSRDDITIELTGIFEERKNGKIEGTVTQIACKTGDDEPTWDISGMSYDFEKLFTRIDDGKREKVIQDIFGKKDDIWGSHFDDQLYGFKGNDHVVGWNGNDRINGGPGKDKLTGDATGDDINNGNLWDDTFVFNSELKSHNIDKITDYSIGHDIIELSRKIFSGFEKGHLHESRFVISKHAVGEDPQIIYRKVKGHILYDPDGTGPEEAMKFARVDRDKPLTHEDFIVV